MMIICGSLIVLQCVLMPANGFQRPVIDQSQTGELNVHINLKDLHILALLKGRTEEYVDYDYAYDYSEMTIKPNNSTTSKPANVANVTEENATETTTQLVTERPTTARNVTAAPPTAETTVAAPPVAPSDVPSAAPPVAPPAVPSAAPLIARPTAPLVAPPAAPLNAPTTVFVPLADTTTPAPAPKNATECRKNYVKNKNGECEFTLYDSSSTNASRSWFTACKINIKDERIHYMFTQAEPQGKITETGQVIAKIKTKEGKQKK